MTNHHAEDGDKKSILDARIERAYANEYDAAFAAATISLVSPDLDAMNAKVPLPMRRLPAVRKSAETWDWTGISDITETI